MLNPSSSQTPWDWPVDVERYDRTPGLKPQEIAALNSNLPRLEQGALPFNVMRQAKVHRLLEPVEDVFNHVRFQRTVVPR